MKVLMISADFPPKIGGIATFSHNIVKALREVGCDIDVITSVGEGRGEMILDAKVLRIGDAIDRRFFKVIPLFMAALWSCKENRPDKLMLMTCAHEGLVGYLLRLSSRIRYGVVAHGSEILRRQRSDGAGRLLMRLVFSAAEVVIANSNYTKGLLVSLGLAKDKIVVVNPPIDLAAYDTAIDTRAVEDKYGLGGRRVLLSVGRLVKRKGHAKVIEVLCDLKEMYPDIVYVIVGEGEFRSELEGLISSYGIGDRVRMTGHVSHTELQQLYKLCEIFIMPAEEDRGDIEGFGIALLEAGVFGKPVIAGRSGGVEEAVVDEETGLLIDPSNLEEIKQKLAMLLDNEPLRNRLGKNGQARVASDFNLKKQGHRLTEALRLGECR